jgi:hypothetical protein
MKRLAWRRAGAATGTGATTIEVRLNGTLVVRTPAARLGTAGIRTIQIGNDTSKQTFNLVADNVRRDAVIEDTRAASSRRHG